MNQGGQTAQLSETTSPTHVESHESLQQRGSVLQTQVSIAATVQSAVAWTVQQLPTPIAGGLQTPPMQELLQHMALVVQAMPSVLQATTLPQAPWMQVLPAQHSASPSQAPPFGVQTPQALLMQVLPAQQSAPVAQSEPVPRRLPQGWCSDRHRRRAPWRACRW